MGKEKTDDLEFIEEDVRRKLIEERRKLIAERKQKAKEIEAIMIKQTPDETGGLQGFDNINLFKDISRYVFSSN
jgi:hypothetical protein